MSKNCPSETDEVFFNNSDSDRDDSQSEPESQVSQESRFSHVENVLEGCRRTPGSRSASAALSQRTVQKPPTTEKKRKSNSKETNSNHGEISDEDGSRPHSSACSVAPISHSYSDDRRKRSGGKRRRTYASPRSNIFTIQDNISEDELMGTSLMARNNATGSVEKTPSSPRFVNSPDESVEASSVSSKTSRIDDPLRHSTPRSRISLIETQGTNVEAIKSLGKRVKKLADSNEKVLANQAKIMKTQSDILENLKLLASTRTKPQANKVDIPTYIRNAVKDGFLSGVKQGKSWLEKDGTNAYLKPESVVNLDMTKYIYDYVEGLYPTTEPGVSKAATERYFETYKQKMQRRSKGQDDGHKRNMVIYERKKRKRDRRIAAAKKKKWSQEEITRVTNSLKLDFMSSEESDNSDGEAVFCVKPLSWRSEKFCDLLRVLDEKADSVQTGRSDRQRTRRVDGAISQRQPPANIDENDRWVLKSA